MDKLQGSQYKDYRQVLAGSETAKTNRSMNISVSESFLEQIDKEKQEQGYSSRSKFVRDKIQEAIEE